MHGVAVSETHAYVADDDSGLHILPAQCDPSLDVGEDDWLGSTMLLRAYPNPGSHQAFIDFETRNEGQVLAGVYDVAGRRICRLSDAILRPGSHHLLWDGRDESGRAVSAGIYLVRVSTAEGSTRARFVMVR